tara:strand:- start:124681 stop:127134 length:2454 start_codon:yes stop_codon:yes gene_type:complete
MLFKNYIISAWRNIYNHKLFSAINILGLSIGLAAVMLIALFVRDELSYDKFWANSDNIYRMHQTFLPSGRPPMEFSSSAGPINNVLKKDFPQIEHVARASTQQPTLILDNKYFQEDITIVDSDLLNILDFKATQGDLKTALSDNTSLILNETLAVKYFGTTEASGKTITLDFDIFKRDFKVTAVIEDLPVNSQIDITSMILLNEEEWKVWEWMFDSWFSVNSDQFFTVAPGTNIDDINSQMPAFIDRNFQDSGSDDPTSSFVVLNSMNIEDLHLRGPGINAGSINTVLTFSAVAILILFIASINFMNLSTARASQRAKEVSLRKVMGASRKNLILQFIGESILVTLFSLLLALVMVELALPAYNDVIGKTLMVDYASSDLINILLLAITAGFLGGVYPAFILSGFRPAEVLKANKSAETGASVRLRSALVIVQFAVSISLFVSTAVVYGQMLYAKSMDLGYDKENMLVIHDVHRDAATEKLPLLVNELRRSENVSNVTWSDFTPGRRQENNTTVRSEDLSRDDAILLGNRSVGYNYFNTYNIQLLSGRAYDREHNDIRTSFESVRAGNGYISSIIINETALRRLGLGSPEDAIGKILYRGMGDDLEMVFSVIGVVPDIHFDSLKAQIRPEMYVLRHENASHISVRFNGDPQLILEKARTLWEQEVPSVPFSYDFAEDAVAEQYRTEEGEATMFAAFSGLAILIACLGLYGLASFSAERRTKEIGIRKVMGANVFDIVKLLLWQFSTPVVIANLIAWPVSFFAMSIWLEGFVYRIESFVILSFCLVAGIAALLIAWVTVAGNSMRVARANPIDALRYE